MNVKSLLHRYSQPSPIDTILSLRRRNSSSSRVHSVICRSRSMTYRFSRLRRLEQHCPTYLNAAPIAHFTCTMAGGFQVPAPAGRIDGGVCFGQYRRITM